ncbi:hypothetical protein B0H14DRAFT_2408817 [Mycena olivaceomarginata]|nr:hypothetical protein B0H14DRAFT_2408817 [Mycena olivaceomarginata]
MCVAENLPPSFSDLRGQTIRNGDFQHLIVQPEQLKMFQGHLPRLARILSIPQFAKTIARVHIDEVHNHSLADLPHYGLPAFRPAWGSLNEFRLRLPKGAPFKVGKTPFGL